MSNPIETTDPTTANPTTTDPSAEPAIRLITTTPPRSGLPVVEVLPTELVRGRTACPPG